MKITIQKMKWLVAAAVTVFTGATWAATTSSTVVRTYTTSTTSNRESGYSTYASGRTLCTTSDDENYSTLVQLPDLCGVAFDATGGMCTEGVRYVDRGSAVGTLPEATREGWTFLGWFTEMDTGVKILESTVVQETVTYYAHWSDECCCADAGNGYALYGAVYDGDDVVGIVELKLGKVNARTNTSRVSGTVTLLDGKKQSIKSQQAVVGGSAPISLEVKNLGTMDVTIGDNQFSGTLGGWRVQTANVGGNWRSSGVTVSVEAGELSALPATVLDFLLPNPENGDSSGTGWTFAKAANVRWAKPKANENPVVLDAESGKGLIVDTSRGKTNLSGIKLVYTPKTGAFKGSFNVYALEGSGRATKLKRYTARVVGVVVDGVGYGSATCRRPEINWPITVR